MVGADPEEDKLGKLEQLCKTLQQSLEASKKREQEREAREGRRKEVVCYNCREKGHYKSECPKPIRTPERKQQGNGGARLDQ